LKRTLKNRICCAIAPLAILFTLSKTACAQDKFELLWEQKFDSTAIDYARWSNHYLWGRTIRNNPEIEYYTSGKNFEFTGTILKIIGKPERITAAAASTSSDSATFTCSSGMLRTNEKFRYGKFEMRCKLPDSPGSWPAFWLFSERCGEIDIFEHSSKQPYRINENYHYDSSGVKREDFSFIKLDKRPNFTRQFHTYTLEWQPDTVQWFIDGMLVRTAVHHLSCDMELIANLALANDKYWGHIPKRKRWKAVFEIDYIKVWKLKEL